MTRAGLLALPVLLVTSLVQAQAADAREQVIDLATIEAAHALCGFDLSDAQEDAIGQQRQDLVDAGAITAAEIAAIGDGIKASLQRQVSEGLCRKDGPEARLYRHGLDALGSGAPAE